MYFTCFCKQGYGRSSGEDSWWQKRKKKKERKRKGRNPSVLAWKGRFLNSPWIIVQTICKVQQRWSFCLGVQDWPLSTPDHSHAAVPQVRVLVSGLHYSWQLSSYGDAGAFLYLCFDLCSHLNWDLETPPVAHREVSLPAQPHSSCKDIDLFIFPKRWAEISDSASSTQ